ncbi:MAG: hypothetical protein JO214_05685 [Frankiaceae bacterium]|nr:hypothetical protein [Frankiaceae bacterium]
MTDKPRFNHVAMTVPADLLDEAGRAAILEFYGDVFGWQEMPTMTVDRQRLVLMAYEFGQFVFLEADEHPMQTTFMDHYGMAVADRQELAGMLERARAWEGRDERVLVKDNEVEDFGVLELSSFYVNFLLPLTIEVQHFDWKQTG